MPTEITLHNTPLRTEHISLGAKMVPFGGWNMPLQYEGILAEWEYNRRTCSIFDCSHMGEFLIKGSAVKSGLDRIVTQSIVDMPLKSCRYGTALNAQGGTMDDLIVYRKALDEWMIVVNAANIEKDAANFKNNLTKDALFTDISFQTAKLDLQGPWSRDVLKTLVPDIGKLEYYTFDDFVLLGERAVISRTGYTGELGYEIYYPWDKVVVLWKEFLKREVVKPTGLGARDVLRVEMAYPLYGHELDENITPLEAGLGKFIDWNKEFIGREALRTQKSIGIKRCLACVLSDSRRSPRSHHKIFDQEGNVIGEVTSGTFSPALQLGIGIAFIEKDKNILEKKIIFGDDKTACAATLVSRPFYKQGSLKN